MANDKHLDLGLLLSSLQNILVGFIQQIPFIAIGLIVFAAFWLASRIVSRVIVATGERTRLDTSLATLLSRVAATSVTVLGVLVAAVVIFPTFKPGDLVAGLGITSVAIGFAFKDILQNFFAGVLLLLRQPFLVGDQIRSGEFEGVVEEINVRSTRLKTYDGERAVLPNGDVYTRAILVRTAYDRRRANFVVGIGYEDSIEKARAIILDVVAKTEGVFKDPEPWTLVTELAPSSVNFTVYFWTKSPQADYLRTRDKAMTAVKLALDAAQIDMPYPHDVVILKNEQQPSNQDHG